MSLGGDVNSFLRRDHQYVMKMNEMLLIITMIM